jgi:transposase-like protein
MSDKTDKLIRSVYPHDMVGRVKSLFRSFSPQERFRAIQLMKEQKKMFNKIEETHEVDGDVTPF